MSLANMVVLIYRDRIAKSMGLSRMVWMKNKLPRALSGQGQENWEDSSALRCSAFADPDALETHRDQRTACVHRRADGGLREREGES